ncbi:hypothetical protein GGU11DRAFT_744948 [Lentinula aff. detonsa]|nr:hypothetical protein GGU11DRAFT_744948 [Lentinula aff. detonsa]
MSSHGYNTRGNQTGRSDLNMPGVPPANSPHQEGGEDTTVSSTTRVGGVNNSEPKRLGSPLTSIASSDGPSNDLSAPAGPENETAPAGPENTASNGPAPVPPIGNLEQGVTSAGITAGGRDNALRDEAPELFDLRLPPPLINTKRNDRIHFDDKMKGPDARNWGNADLEEADIDPEIQVQIFRSLQSTRNEQQISTYFEEWKAAKMERIQREVQASMAGRINELEKMIKMANITAKQDDLKRATSVEPKERTAAEGLTKARATMKKCRESTPNRPSDLIAPKSHIAYIFTKLKERTSRDNGSSPDSSDDSSGGDPDGNNSMNRRKKG